MEKVLSPNTITDAISQYGFPIVAAVGMGFIIYYVWKWVTTEIKPVLGAMMGTLIGLIDRIRMLDNDMIRLQQKLNMVLEYKEQYEKNHIISCRNTSFNCYDSYRSEFCANS